MQLTRAKKLPNTDISAKSFIFFASCSAKLFTTVAIVVYAFHSASELFYTQLTSQQLSAHMHCTVIRSLAVTCNICYMLFVTYVVMLLSCMTCLIMISTCVGVNLILFSCLHTCRCYD